MRVWRVLLITLLLLPVARSAPAQNADTHTVKAGETLYRISVNHNISVAELKRLNGLTENIIYPGQTLRVSAAPGSVEVVTKAPDEITSAGPTLTLRGAAPLTPDARGAVSVYPDSYIGRLTAGGEPYDPGRFTVGHPSLPFGTIVLLTNPANERRTFARVNDRGPATAGLMLEVSAAVAGVLGMRGDGRRAIELYVVE